MDDQEKKRQEELRELGDEGWEEMQEEEIGLANLSQEQLKVRLERITKRREQFSEKLNDMKPTDPAYDRLLQTMEEDRREWDKIDQILNPPEDFTLAELDMLELQDFPNRQAREDLSNRLRSQWRRQKEKARATTASDKSEVRDRMEDEIDLWLKIESKIKRLQNPQAGIIRITIENFKGISAPVTIRLRPITLLFGANSAGKSTILQALHYARELLDRNNANADTTLLGGEAIELGGFRNIVHRHDLARPIRIRLDITPTADGVPTIQEILGIEDQENDAGVWNINSEVEGVSIELVSRWDPDRQLAWFAECNYWINHQSVISLRKAKPDARPTIEFIDYFHPVFLALDESIGEARKQNDKAIAEFRSELHGSLMTRLVKNARMEKLGFDVVRTGTGEILIGKDQALTKELLHGLVAALPGVACRTNAAELFPQAQLEIEEAVKRFVEREIQLKKDLGFYPLIQLSGREQLSPHPEKPLPFQAEALGEGREHYYDLINQIVVGITNLASQQLKNFRYIGPIRDIPDRDHEAPQIADPARWADGQGAWDLLLHHYDAVESREVDFVEQVSKWFEDADRLDLHYRIEVVGTRRVDEDDPVMTQLRMLQNQYEERSAQDFRKNVLQPLKTAAQKTRIRIVDLRTNTEVGPKDIGIGVAQSLPIVVAALDTESKLLAIEQPELHLHPTAQARLGDLFISGAKNGRLFLLETHSELFILRLLKRIRKTTAGEVADERLQLTPGELGVLHVERTAEQTIVTELGVDAQGEFLRQWPGKDGFFEERARELFE